MPYITVASIIGDCTINDDSLHHITLKVLQNYNSFINFTPFVPVSASAGTLKMCDVSYISSVMNNVFRADAPKPTPDMLDEVNFYVNNGFYYYYGENKSSIEAAYEIITTIHHDNDNYLIIFSNKADDDTETYSTLNLGKDSDGYFIKSIDMDTDFSKINEKLTPAPSITDLLVRKVKEYLPSGIAIITFITVIIILFKFVLS